MDGPDRVEKFFTDHALHHIAFCTSCESTFNVSVTLKGVRTMVRAEG